MLYRFLSNLRHKVYEYAMSILAAAFRFCCELRFNRSIPFRRQPRAIRYESVQQIYFIPHLHSCTFPCLCTGLFFVKNYYAIVRSKIALCCNLLFNSLTCTFNMVTPSPLKCILLSVVHITAFLHSVPLFHNVFTSLIF